MVSAGNDVTLCSGSSTPLVATPIGAKDVTKVTYSWTPVLGLDKPLTANPVATPTTTTTYTVKVTEGTCTATSKITVTINPLPAANVGSNNKVCLGSAILLGKVAVAGNTYLWSSDKADASLTDANKILSNPTVSPTQTTTYTLRETITATGCYKDNSILVTVNPLPPATVGTNNNVCLGSSIGIGTAISTTGNKYLWTADPTDPSLTPAKLKTSYPLPKPVVTTKYTLTETSADGCVNTNSITVVVNPLPVADFSFSTGNCSGTPIQFTNSLANPSGYTYDWSFGDGAKSTDPNPTHEYIASGSSGTKSFDVSLKVTDKTTGCISLPVKKTVTVGKSPDPSLDISSKTNYDNTQGMFVYCGSDITHPNYKLTIYNGSSTIGSNTSYDIDWGDGTSNKNISDTLTFTVHQYKTLGLFKITFTAYNATTGCSAKKTYQFFSGNTPYGNLGGEGNTSGCVPYTVKWPVESTQKNPPGTQYWFTVNDGSPDQYYTQSTIPDTISHEFTKASCGQKDENGKVTNKWYVKLIIKNPCDSLGVPVPIATFNKPQADFTNNLDSVICTSKVVTFTDGSVGTYLKNGVCVSDYNKIWTIKPATGWKLINGSLGTPLLGGSSFINIRFDNPGRYSINLKIQQGPDFNRCTGDTLTKNICVEAPLVPQFTLDKIAGCSPFAVKVTNTTDITQACKPPKYLWAITYKSGNCGTSSNFVYINGTSDASANPSIQFNNSGIYEILLIATNSCGTFLSATKQTVTVRQPPIISILPIASICQTYPTTTINPTAIISDCGSLPLTYEWTFTGGIPATSASANPGSIIYNTPGTYSAILKVTNDCGSISVTSNLFTIFKTPTATIGGTKTVCLNSGFPGITFTGANGTAPYTFTYRINGGSQLSVTTTSGNSVTILVPTTTAGTFDYSLVSVKDKNIAACSQLQTGTATIKVNPLPDGVVSNNGDACLNGTSPIVTFTGSKGTAPYTFAYNINGGASKTVTTSAGNSVTISQPTTITGTFQYNLVSISDASSTTCSHSLTGVSTIVHVNPIPTATLTGTVNVCLMEPAPITFTGANGTAPYTFTYNLDGEPVQKITTESGNSIALLVPTNKAGTFKYNLLSVQDATSTACSQSQTGSVTVTVINSPVVIFTPAGDQTVCSGGTTQSVTMSTTTVGATLTWRTVIPPGISGVSTTTGGITIPVQTLTNTTSSPVVVTYYSKIVLASGGACSGIEFPYTVTVNPRPNIPVSLKTTVCSSATFTFTPTDGSGNIVPTDTKYTWETPTMSPTGAITDGSAQNTAQNTFSQTLTNTTKAIATATYKVTPISGDCAGKPFNLVVTVNPTGQVIQPVDQVVCNGQTTIVNFLTSNTDGKTTYEWTNSNPAIGLKTSTGTGNLSFSATNTGTTPITSTISVTPIYANGGVSCNGVPRQFTITVNPTGQVNDIDNQVLCHNQQVTLSFATVNTGGTTTYSWKNNNTKIGLPASGTGDLSFTASNSGTSPIKGTITVTPTFTDPNGGKSCQGTSKTFTITVNPAGQVNAIADQIVCNTQKTTVNFATLNTVGLSEYSWTNDNQNIGLGLAGASSISFTASNAEQTQIKGNFIVTPIFTNLGVSCPGTPQNFSITVNPSPLVTFTPAEQIICSGNQTLEVTLNSVTPNVNFSWTSSPPTGITGTALSDGGTIPVQTPVNNTSNPIDVIYKAKAIVQDGSSTCAGGESLYKITVNPVPLIAADMTATICSGGKFELIPADGSGNIIPAGTTYTWSAPSIGPSATAITGASAQATDQTTISQALTNISYDVATATYTVTPKTGNCTGNTFQVIVTVNPQPQLNKIDDIYLCPGQINPQINLTGNVEGTVFDWTSSSTLIGIKASGTDQIPSFTALNNVLIPLNSTIGVNLTANDCVFSIPSAFTITVNPSLPVSVAISANTNNICSGTNVTFTAVPTNGGLNPVYQWLVNSASYGTNSPVFIYQPVDGDKVECLLTSDATCPSGNPAHSNVIDMVIFSRLPSTIEIVANANNLCPGDSVTFTATTFNEGSNPIYQWYEDGKKVGKSFPTYSFVPIDGDLVKCQLTSSNGCSTSKVSMSNELTLVVALPAIIPSFEIINTNVLKQCAPLNVVLRNISPTTGLKYIWDFGDGQKDSSAFKELVPHSYQNFTDSTKTYKIGLKILAYGTHCFIETKDSIVVDPEINAGSPVNYEGCSPVTKTFENAKPGAKSYKWIAGDKTTILSTAFKPTFTFEALHQVDTTFVVYLVAESAKSCFDTIVNTIKVSPPLVIPSFSYTGKADCKTVTYTFQNTSPEGPSFYLWDFDDGTINKTYHANETIVHTFRNGTDVPITFNVTLTSNSGSYCSFSTSQKITVYPKFTAGFPVTFQGCNPVKRTFENAFSGARSYKWVGANGNLLSTQMTPELIFTNSTGRDSTYKVLLIAESLTGCIDTVVNSVIVRTANKTEFTGVPAAGCAPLTVQFNPVATPQIKSYQWDFGDNSDFAVTQNPRHIFINSSGSDTTYNVTLLAYNQYGCTDTVSHQVHLMATPQVDFIASPLEQVYPFRTVQITNLTPPGNWTYTWDFNDQKPLQTGTVTSYTYDFPGQYVISLLAKGTECQNTKYVSILIKPGLPVASFEPDTAGCAPLKVTFRNDSKNGSRYLWEFGNGVQSAEFSPSTTYYDEGTFIVKLNVTNQFGVRSVTQRTIVIHPVPKALFKPLPYRVKIPAQAVTFSNYSENGKSYVWDFGDGTSSTETNPIHIYTKTGLFDVLLYMTSNEGCKDSLLLPGAVEAFSDGLKVPNAFLPSKDGPSTGYYIAGDPRNNIFYPSIATGDFSEYEMLIYNRWGNLLFISNEPQKGWDGYYNGKLCPQDVYIWKIKCKYKSGDTVTKTGDVTLIR